MLKINKIYLDKILDSSTGQAFNLEIITDGGLAWSASLVVDEADLDYCTDNTTWAKAKQVLEKIFINLEVDGGLWMTVSAQLANPKFHNSLSKTLRLLVEIVAIKASSGNKYLGSVEYINEAFGFNQEMFMIPTPLITIFNGGKFADTNLDFEDYLLIPLTKNKDTYQQKLEESMLVYKKIATLLKSSGYDSDTGALGGYAPNLVSSLEALDIIQAGINIAGFNSGEDFGIGLNIGSSNLYDDTEHKYLFKLSHNYFNTANLNGLYHEWLRHYPILYLEDCLSEHDLEGWQLASQDFRESLVLAGNKLFEGGIKVFRQLLKYKLGNTIVLNLKSADDLMELADIIKLAKKHNYQVVLSAGEAETSDDFVADFAVASNVDFVKFGSLCRAERVVKYNKLLTIATKLENFC